MTQNKKTALITGASSGIGKTYAGYLASLGYDLILVARREKLLTELANDLTAKYKVNSEILTADLSQHEGVVKVKEFLNNAAPDAFIHAAGYGTRGFFYEVDEDLIERQVYLMTVAGTVLARAVLPAMIEKKEGVIIFVSSVAAFISTAQYPVYSAVKTYANTFITGLRDELAATNIKVQSVCPGVTRTEFMHTEQYKEKNFDYSFVPEKYWQDPEDVVKESWERLTKKYKPIIVTGKYNRFLVGMLTAPFIGGLIKKRISKNIRKRIKKGLPVEI
ncbi:MAG: SDR family NAD(P)-dependent oxidoreductase [Chlorobi bacterium]|nr:SDR family NAD(P)-dependent oxidoreductase [Chlorobiota bacterium]